MGMLQKYSRRLGEDEIKKIAQIIHESSGILEYGKTKNCKRMRFWERFLGTENMVPEVIDAIEEIHT